MRCELNAALTCTSTCNNLSVLHSSLVHSKFDVICRWTRTPRLLTGRTSGMRSDQQKIWTPAGHTRSPSLGGTWSSGVISRETGGRSRTSAPTASRHFQVPPCRAFTSKGR